MDKLTIISGCLFLAADIFAIASIANPDWINTGESAGERRARGSGGVWQRGGETLLRGKCGWRGRGGGRPEEQGGEEASRLRGRAAWGPRREATEKRTRRSLAGPSGGGERRPRLREKWPAGETWAGPWSPGWGRQPPALRDRGGTSFVLD